MNILQPIVKSLNQVLRYGKKQSPIILAAVGVSGFIGSTIMASKATIKARKAIAQAENDKSETLTKFETVKVAAPYYIPTGLVIIASTGCIAGSVRISYRRQAALAAAYTLSRNQFNDFYQKTVETIGDKKTQSIEKAIENDKAKTCTGASPNVVVEAGDVLARDFSFGREFSSNGNKILAAQNRINAKLSKSSESYISLNEAWRELGIPTADIGDYMGWNSTKLGLDGIDIMYNYTKGEDEQPFLWMKFIPMPEYDYNHY